jgi:hypothetical protein
MPGEWTGAAFAPHDHVGASLIEVARQPARMMDVTGRLDSSSPCATPGLSNAERLLSRRQAKHPDHRRVEKQVHEAPSRVVGPLTRLLSWPRRGASHDCVKSQCTDAQAYLVLELQGEGAEHDSGDEYCCGDNVAIGHGAASCCWTPLSPQSIIAN